MPGTIHIQGDITNYGSMRKICSELAQKHDGHLDFLVNNAGATYKCLGQDFPIREFNLNINVNVTVYSFMSNLLSIPEKKPAQGTYH